MMRDSSFFQKTRKDKHDHVDKVKGLVHLAKSKSWVEFQEVASKISENDRLSLLIDQDSGSGEPKKPLSLEWIIDNKCWEALEILIDGFNPSNMNKVANRKYSESSQVGIHEGLSIFDIAALNNNVRLESEMEKYVEFDLNKTYIFRFQNLSLSTTIISSWCGVANDQINKDPDNTLLEWKYCLIGRLIKKCEVGELSQQEINLLCRYIDDLTAKHGMENQDIITRSKAVSEMLIIIPLKHVDSTFDVADI